MSDEIERLSAQAHAMWEEGAEAMWRNIFADTVIEMLNRDEIVTRDSLRERLVGLIADDTTSRLDRASLQGALKGLDGKMPKL